VACAHARVLTTRHVDDDLGIYRLRGGTATLWAGPDLHPALADLEGVTANGRGDVVWALSEEHGTLVEMHLGARGPRVRRTAVLERPGTAKKTIWRTWRSIR
jgi:hypothetical protein